MIAYLKGKLIEVDVDLAIVDVSNVGYRVTIPQNCSFFLKNIGNEITVYTAHIIRENYEALFGFSTKEEIELFEKLITISGVGPKTALGLIGFLSFEECIIAIQMGHTHVLAKAPGIGKKTAERLVIDLRDKINKMIKAKPSIASNKHLINNDAVNALTNLGYNNFTANLAVKKVLESSEKELSLSEIITKALRLQIKK